MWNPDNNINFISDWIKIVTWLKETAFPAIKTVAIFLLGLIIKAGVLIGRYGKQFTIAVAETWPISRYWKQFVITVGLLLFLYGMMALIPILWVLLPRSVFYAILVLLPFAIILGAMIRFQKQIGCYRKKRRYESKTKSKQTGPRIKVVHSEFGKKFEFTTKLIIPFVGVVGGLFFLIPTYCEYQKQNTLLAVEKFKNAIDQLGSEKQATVLGSVHALHNLAVKNQEDYSQPVFEIFSSFIREETTKDEYKQRASKDPSIVIQTIVDKLFREEKSRKFYPKDNANLTGAFLQRMNFNGASLQEADLTNASLQRANLLGTNLQGAILEKADLQGANLNNANLWRAKLFNADLQGANLLGANLQWAILENANLQGANLLGVNLQGVNFQGANLQEANLKNANLWGAKLFNANLQGADLSNANLLGADLSGANLQWANLGSANLLGADLRTCHKITFTIVTLIQVQFYSSIFPGCRFE